MSQERHFTTRRGFVGAMGFGALGLYATWATYGASPLPFGLGDAPADPKTDHAAGAGDHGGHAAPASEHTGHGAPAADPVMATSHGGGAGLSPHDFEQRHAAFLERFRQADGSIRPTADGAALGGDTSLSMPMAMDMPDMIHAGGHDMAAPDVHAGHSGHAMTDAPSAMADHGPISTKMGHDGHDGSAPPVASHAGHGGDAAATPIEVYLSAGRFSFEPDDLHLEVGHPYRFHMMATDVAHGASIAFGQASRIVRLRPDTVTTLDLTFRTAGEHLVYCSVYCGPGHDTMHGKITVA